MRLAHKSSIHLVNCDQQIRHVRQDHSTIILRNHGWTLHYYAFFSWINTDLDYGFRWAPWSLSYIFKTSNPFPIHIHILQGKDDLELTINRARRLFFRQLGSRTTIKQYRLVRNQNLFGQDYTCIFSNGKNWGELWSYIYISLILFQDSLCLKDPVT